MFAQKTMVQPILVRITLFILKLIGLSFTRRTQNKANKEKIFSRNRQRNNENTRQLVGIFYITQKV